MSPRNPDAEAALEAEVMTLFRVLGYDEVLNAEHEIFGPDGTLGRANRGEVVLLRDLWPRLVSSGIDVSELEIELEFASNL